MLYAPWPYNVLYPVEDAPTPECVATPYGFAEGLRTEKGFVVGRLITTDLSVYLRQGGPGGLPADFQSGQRPRRPQGR